MTRCSSARENVHLPEAGDGVDTLDVESRSSTRIDCVKLRGDPVPAVGNMNAWARWFAEAVDQIDAELSRGPDVATTNAEIKEALGVVGGAGAINQHQV